MPPVNNTLLTISMITREGLRVLENNLSITKHVDRQLDDKFGVDGAKIGATVNIRKPPKYIGRLGAALQLEDSVETMVPCTLDTQFGVDIQFSSTDLALSIDDFSDRFLKPAVAVIANKIDSDVCNQYRFIWNSVGSPGTVPNTLLTYLLAGVALDNNACPQDDMRGLFLSPLMQAYIVDALKGLFQQSTQIAEQYMKGQMGRAIGFTWAMDQNIVSHTAGTFAGVPLVAGANQTGAALLTKGWSATSLKAGDTFTLAGVYAINPVSRRSTGVLQTFVVRTPSTDTAGNMTVQISPSIVTTGAFQTVSGSPADNAPITMLSATGASSSQGLAIHRDCITLACADLPIPRGVDMAGRASDEQLGISIRMVRAYDINTDNFPMRLDVLYGMVTQRPELGCRIQG